MPQILPMQTYSILSLLMLSIVSLILLNEMKWKNSVKKKESKKKYVKHTFFLSLFIS
nr:ATP synthase F0 subunit 8 [Thrips palmi]UKT59929.1 ATP synthase F0 subunit 8 [Thrips palmi]